MHYLDDDRPCSIGELENIITAPSDGFTMYPNNAFDEVVDGIFIGEGIAAKSINCMKRLGITHVLNAALGKDRFHVNTNHVMYQKVDIRFLGIEATDFINCDLSEYFNIASDFIEEGVNQRGKVFVHCVQGVSRSSTLVLAYLMLKCHMTVQNALQLVRSKREVCPNDGFLQQLCDFNEKLKNSGHFNTPLSKHGDSAADLSPKTTGVVSCVGDVKEENWMGEDVQKPGNLSGNSSIDNSNENIKVPNSFETKSDTSCTVEGLESILTASSGGLMLMPNDLYNQINRHIFISGSDFAVSTDSLKAVGITHVLNAAHNKGVKADPDMYRAVGIDYCGLGIEDTTKFDLSPYFDQAVKFIESAIDQKGRVLVNCAQGVSRSAALVVAFLMIKHHMTVQSALNLVREKREVCPNSYFLQQLCDLDDRLKQ